MSADDASEPAGLAGPVREARGGFTPAGAEPKSPESKEESKYAGLRDLAKQKEIWSNYLRWILIVSFALQVALLIAIVAGRTVDEWTARGILLQFTAMFIAALRYLFK